MGPHGRRDILGQHRFCYDSCVPDRQQTELGREEPRRAAMSVTLFTDRRMLNHRVPARHPERPERLQAILRHLERTGYLATCPGGVVREATDDELRRVHPAEYLRRVIELEADGGGMLDPD